MRSAARSCAGTQEFEEMSPSNLGISLVKTSTAIRPSAQNSSTEKSKMKQPT